MEKEILEGSGTIARFMGVFMKVTNKLNEWEKNSTLLEVTPIYELPFIFIPTETRHISQTDDFNKIRESALDVSWGRVCQKAKYHTSWDWLMPVVEKIESINNGQFKFTVDPWDIQIIEYASGNEDCICLIQRDELTLIECYWETITDFITWYNSQSKTNNNGK